MRCFIHRATIVCALAALTLSALPAQAQGFSEQQRGEIEHIMREYLIAHPEVLQDVLGELDKRQTEAEAAKHREGVKQYAKALLYSPRQVTIGNRQGDVTLVEFFDYNCGYCRRALSDMLNLMKGDPKLRVVLKEFPVLGPGSVEAAHVAVAVRMQDPTGHKYLEFHQKLLGGRGEVDRARSLAVAKDIGLDMARLEKDMGSAEPKATIEENMKMADALGLNGTPSYVVGGDVIVGAVGLAALKEKIDSARKEPAIADEVPAGDIGPRTR
jgi:protein-disulfide isomerase